MPDFIDNIISQKLPVFFISPHLDDAVFSAGALLSYLSSRTSVTVINVFTSPGYLENSLSARAFLRQCGYSSASQLYHDRLAEDNLVMQSIPAKNINLNYIDALWRPLPNLNVLTLAAAKFIPELALIYPTYRWHISRGCLSPADIDLVRRLSEKLSALVPSSALVFGPVAAGNHVDHVLVRRACAIAFKNPVLWLDFPYSQSYAQTQLTGHVPVVFSKNLSRKQFLIQGYASQAPAVFPHGIKVIPETFYISNK